MDETEWEWEDRGGRAGPAHPAHPALISRIRNHSAGNDVEDNRT